MTGQEARPLRVPSFTKSSTSPAPRVPCADFANSAREKFKRRFNILQQVAPFLLGEKARQKGFGCSLRIKTEPKNRCAPTPLLRLTWGCTNKYDNISESVLLSEAITKHNSTAPVVISRPPCPRGSSLLEARKKARQPPRHGTAAKPPASVILLPSRRGA